VKAEQINAKAKRRKAKQNGGAPKRENRKGVTKPGESSFGGLSAATLGLARRGSCALANGGAQILLKEVRRFRESRMQGLLFFD
jgi:hypothetical protein